MQSDDVIKSILDYAVKNTPESSKHRSRHPGAQALEDEFPKRVAEIVFDKNVAPLLLPPDLTTEDARTEHENASLFQPMKDLKMLAALGRAMGDDVMSDVTMNPDFLNTIDNLASALSAYQHGFLDAVRDHTFVDDQEDEEDADTMALIIFECMRRTVEAEEKGYKVDWTRDSEKAAKSFKETVKKQQSPLDPMDYDHVEMEVGSAVPSGLETEGGVARAAGRVATPAATVAGAYLGYTYAVSMMADAATVMVDYSGTASVASGILTAVSVGHTVYKAWRLGSKLCNSGGARKTPGFPKLSPAQVASLTAEQMWAYAEIVQGSVAADARLQATVQKSWYRALLIDPALAFAWWGAVGAASGAGLGLLKHMSQIASLEAAAKFAASGVESGWEKGVNLDLRDGKWKEQWLKYGPEVVKLLPGLDRSKALTNKNMNNLLRSVMRQSTTAGAVVSAADMNLNLSVAPLLAVLSEVLSLAYASSPAFAELSKIGGYETMGSLFKWLIETTTEVFNGFGALIAGGLIFLAVAKPAWRLGSKAASFGVSAVSKTLSVGKFVAPFFGNPALKVAKFSLGWVYDHTSDGLRILAGAGGKVLASASTAGVRTSGHLTNILWQLYLSATLSELEKQSVQAINIEEYFLSFEKLCKPGPAAGTPLGIIVNGVLSDTSPWTSKGVPDKVVYPWDSTDWPEDPKTPGVKMGWKEVSKKRIREAVNTFWMLEPRLRGRHEETFRTIVVSRLLATLGDMFDPNVKTFEFVAAGGQLAGLKRTANEYDAVGGSGLNNALAYGVPVPQGSWDGVFKSTPDAPVPIRIVVDGQPAGGAAGGAAAANDGAAADGGAGAISMDKPPAQGVAGGGIRKERRTRGTVSPVVDEVFAAFEFRKLVV